MEYASGSNLDEQGNPIESKNDTKTFGMIAVLIGIVCSVYVGVRIKRKVDEINK